MRTMILVCKEYSAVGGHGTEMNTISENGATSYDTPSGMGGFSSDRTIAEYAELGNFGVRVVMSYQPNTLAQQFTVDVLYGAAVLRNSFGVQVSS